MTHPEELKPCPFCGGDDILPHKTKSPFEGEEWLHYVYCTVCECQAPGMMTLELSIEAWNTRQPSKENKDG